MLSKTFIIGTWIMASLVVMQAGSCKTKDLAKTDTQQDAKMDADGKRIVSLYVSFYSIAYGIDHQAETGLKNYISSFEQEKSVKISVTEVHWGREGETDYCFELDNLSDALKSEFVAGVRKTLSASKLVHIEENAGCKHEDWNKGQ